MAKPIDDPSVPYANDLTRDIRLIGYDAETDQHRDVYVKVSDVVTARLHNTVYGGKAGEAGYGIAAPYLPPDSPFEPVDALGYYTPTSEFFGNVRHKLSGSIGVVKPAMGFRPGAGVNEWESCYLADYGYDVAAMEADGYFLHREFYAGGTAADPGIVKYKIFDKWGNSKAAQGTGFVAVSVKNGDPLACHADHNPIGDITACAGVNAYYAAVRAPKGRDSSNGEYDPNSPWHCVTRFSDGLMLLLSQCHGQAATSATHCAWYNPSGQSNFPKGCDNNALGSVDDQSLSWVGDGYSNAPKMGSCNDPAKTAVNGQLCDVMEFGGGLYHVSIGMTRGSDQAQGDTQFAILKKHIDPATLDWGQGGALDAWGSVADLADKYDMHDFPALTHTPSWARFGNAANQVLPTSDPVAASLGLPTDPGAISPAGTPQYGNNGIYLYHRPLLCVRSGLSWGNGSLAGVGSLALNAARTHGNRAVGVRAACALSA